MIVHMRPDLVGIRHPFVWSYLLLDGRKVAALDTGMGLTYWRIQRWFARTGRTPEDLQAIVLTHGHLDHAGCAERLRAWSGAKIYLHPADLPITRGEFTYHGWAKVCGALEAIGRPLSRYRTPQIEESLADGQELPFWGGLRVIHVPGHTPGHVCLYSAAKRILFAGDAIISPFNSAGFPPRIFNVDNAQVRESILRLADLEADWVYPMHHVLMRRNLMEDIRGYAARRKLAASASK